MRVLLALFFAGLLAGCSAFGQSPVRPAATDVVYRHAVDGSREISYHSDKEQVGLDVDYEGDENGNPRRVHIKADRSGTPEGFIAAQVEALKVQSQMIQDLLKQILALTAAGGAGS